MGDIAGQIEAIMPLPVSGHEKTPVLCPQFQKAVAEIGAHFIILLADRGANGGADAHPQGAQLFHGLQGGFQHATQRAFPSRMGGADHTGLGIGEQHRRAIRREDAKTQARRRRHHAITLQTLAIRAAPGRPRVDDGAVDLREADQAGIRSERIGHPFAVFRHGCRIVLGPGTAIERGIDALRYAALAPEKAVRDSRIVHSSRFKTLHGGKPATSVMAGGVSASALNRRPIVSLPISRSVAARRFWASAGLAFINCSARSAMPRLARKAPCVTGPATEAPPRRAAAVSAAKSTCEDRSSSPGSSSTSTKRWPPTACRVSAKPVRSP